MVQKLVRVLAPLERCAVQAVVKHLASGVVACAVRFLQHVPSFLSVSKSFPRCAAGVALHPHGGCPALSQENYGVEVSVVSLPLLGQVVVPGHQGLTC